MSRAWLRSVLTLFALAGAVLSAQRSSERTVFNAWAVHDGVKVKRDDRDHPDRLRNAVWDGRTIRLVAARNEGTCVPGHRRSRRFRARRLGGESRAAHAAWRWWGNRLSAARHRSDRVSRPSDPGVQRALHVRDAGKPRNLGLPAGLCDGAEKRTRVDARSAGARERRARTRRISASGWG